MFDLARDLDLHQASTSKTKERIVGGRVSGLIELGEEVTFEAVHFGIRQMLSSKITEMHAPHRFVDQMTKGAFRSLWHLHEFVSVGDSTLMRDTLRIEAPFGPLGWIAERLFLRAYMTQFLMRRNAFLKSEAESRAMDQDQAV